MLKIIGGSILRDIIGLMKGYPDFLNKVAAEKKQILEKVLPDYPEIFKDYLCTITSDQFTSELSEVLAVIQGQGSFKNKNAFLEALALFIVHEFGQLLDSLTHDYFNQNSVEKTQQIKERLKGDHSLNEALIGVLTENTYEELTQQAYLAMNSLKQVPATLVQTPLELSPHMRQGIRQHFLKKYPYAFVEFQVNPQILGGIRVFINGTVIDHSWLAKIQSITQLKF